MPSGALGIWYADEAVTSPRVMIPNAVSAEPIYNNLLSCARRMFTTDAIWSNNNSNATITDNNATAPDGSNDASTVVWGSADALCMFPVENLPAGTYTVAIDVATTDASTVDFRMGVYNSEETKSATATWTSHSVTFVHGAPGIKYLSLVRSVDSSTPANLKICNARLFAGSSDLGAEPPAGHMIFGVNAFNGQPTIAGGILPQGSDTTWGFIQLASDVSALTASTVFVVSCKKAAVNSAQPMFAYRGNVSLSGTMQAMHQFEVQQPGMYLGGDVRLYYEQPGLYLPRLDEWHIHAYRYNGTTVDLWTDGIRCEGEAVAGASQQCKDLMFGKWFVGTYARFATNAAALYPVALTDSEMEDAFAALKARAALSGITTGTDRWLCVEGDSISGNNGTTNLYGGLYGLNSDPPVNGHVRATPGATLDILTARAADVDATIPTNKNGRLFILSIKIGTNNFGGSVSGADFAALVSTYCQARKAAGWDKVVLCTVLPIAGNALHETQRTDYNAIIRAPGWAAANGVDAICDIGAEAIMGDVANATDTDYYSDGVHPTAAGQALMEVVYRATINAL